MDPELLFFLGAGASVAAGVPDTFNLVNEFLKDLEMRRKNSDLLFCKKILEILEKSELASDGKVDVELLLEALDQLENIEECIPLKFIDEHGDYNLSLHSRSDIDRLKKELKDFIKKTGLVSKDKILCLKDLLFFVEDKRYRPLDIFSVNYDICIEQFCNTFEKEYVDGFYLKWEPESLKRPDVDVRLHKIHGSITWYQTDKGSHVKLPIKSEAAEVELITGEKASTLILYPVRKLEYTEPLIDLLMILKTKLNRVKFAFVIGYSFRDNQIRRIFWNAAKRNKELVLILVSPSAHKVYEERLRNYDRGIPSELEGRVICLPYKFEEVLGLLKDVYLRNLGNGLRIESDFKANENLRATVNWEECLGPLINCEYIDKIEQVLPKADWAGYETRDLRHAAKTAFKAFLTSLVSNNSSYKEIWVGKLDDSFSKIIDATQLNFSLVARENERIIQPSFEFAGRSHFRFEDCSKLLRSMLDDCRFKMSLMKEEQTSNLAEVEKMLEKILTYFDRFTEGQITLTEYIKIRKEKYPKLIAQVRQDTPKILSKIEEQELREILGGVQLKFGKD